MSRRKQSKPRQIKRKFFFPRGEVTGWAEEEGAGGLQARLKTRAAGKGRAAAEVAAPRREFGESPAASGEPRFPRPPASSLARSASFESRAGPGFATEKLAPNLARPEPGTGAAEGLLPPSPYSGNFSGRRSAAGHARCRAPGGCCCRCLQALREEEEELAAGSAEQQGPAFPSAPLPRAKSHSPPPKGALRGIASRCYGGQKLAGSSSGAPCPAAAPTPNPALAEPKQTLLSEELQTLCREPIASYTLLSKAVARLHLSSISANAR